MTLQDLNGQDRQSIIRQYVQKYYAKGMHATALQAIILSNEGESISITELELARDYVRRLQKQAQVQAQAQTQAEVNII